MDDKTWQRLQEMTAAVNAPIWTRTRPSYHELFQYHAWLINKANFLEVNTECIRDELGRPYTLYRIWRK